MGAYFPESLFDTPLDYELFAAKNPTQLSLDRMYIVKHKTSSNGHQVSTKYQVNTTK